MSCRPPLFHQLAKDKGGSQDPDISKRNARSPISRLSLHTSLYEVLCIFDCEPRLPGVHFAAAWNYRFVGHQTALIRSRPTPDAPVDTCTVRSSHVQNKKKKKPPTPELLSTLAGCCSHSLCEHPHLNFFFCESRTHVHFRGSLAELLQAHKQNTATQVCCRFLIAQASLLHRALPDSCTEYCTVLLQVLVLPCLFFLSESRRRVL